jgi:uncharacterized membrane protein
VSDGNASSSESYTGTERILAFSDGVFAIAITLLVLDLTPPHVEHKVVQKLLAAWPTYLSYALSFFIIGILWASHHQMFTQIKRSNHVFLLINIVFLMWVAALPFPTALLAEGLSHYDPVGRQAVVAIYTGMFLVCALLFNLEWWYAIYHGRLLGEGADPEAVNRTPPRGLRPRLGCAQRAARSYYIGPVAYLVDLALSFVSVEASLVLFFLLALFYALVPIPVVYCTITGRRGNRTNRLVKD